MQNICDMWATLKQKLSPPKALGYTKNRDEDFKNQAVKKKSTKKKESGLPMAHFLAMVLK